MLETRFGRQCGHAAGVDHGYTGHEPDEKERAEKDSEIAVNQDQRFPNDAQHQLLPGFSDIRMGS